MLGQRKDLTASLSLGGGQWPGYSVSMERSKALGNPELKVAAQQDYKVLGRTGAVTTTAHIT